MSAGSSETGAPLTQELLSHLGLASKAAAWGTLGTLRTFLSFSVDKDVQRLLSAIAGQAVDHRAVLDVLTNRSREQRQLIARNFRERTRQDLLASLRAALSGTLEWTAVALLQPAAQQDAQELRRSLQGDSRGDGRGLLALGSLRAGDSASYHSGFTVLRGATPTAPHLSPPPQEPEPNSQVLARVLISRSETDLLSIRAEFRKKFGKSLYSSLQEAVLGDCQAALLTLCRGEDI
ncbi:PREDICTED: annexin A9 [Condylura cristata]|uniref:annexin A9 n=1 Tax=Condylura cristata TaxID=143302 RepID=UPI0006438597|nr:PREDICTED: annexin A9 [Condylura cristata]